MIALSHGVKGSIVLRSEDKQLLQIVPCKYNLDRVKTSWNVHCNFDSAQLLHNICSWDIILSNKSAISHVGFVISILTLVLQDIGVVYLMVRAIANLFVFSVLIYRSLHRRLRLITFHFLNVGKGHSNIIDFPSGRLTLIDVDDSRSFAEEDLDDIAESLGVKTRFLTSKALYGSQYARSLVEKAYSIELTDPIKYLQTNFPNRSLFRFILTHPDMDHLAGLSRLHCNIGLTNFWDTDNNKVISDSSWSGSPYNKEDWEIYQQLRKSSDSPRCIRPIRSDSKDFWREDGIEILSPTPGLVNLANQTDEFNHSSYILRVSYSGCKILLGGDASKEAQDDILKSVGKSGMKADILFAPHHGSKSSFNRDALEAISPSIIIVSVAVGTDYAYDEYSEFGQVLSTKWYGNITMTITDAGEIKFAVQYQR